MKQKAVFFLITGALLMAALFPGQVEGALHLTPLPHVEGEEVEPAHLDSLLIAYSLKIVELTDYYHNIFGLERLEVSYPDHPGSLAILYDTELGELMARVPYASLVMRVQEKLDRESYLSSPWIVCAPGQVAKMGVIHEDIGSDKPGPGLEVLFDPERIDEDRGSVLTHIELTDHGTAAKLSTQLWLTEQPQPLAVVTVKDKDYQRGFTRERRVKERYFAVYGAAKFLHQLPQDKTFAIAGLDNMAELFWPEPKRELDSMFIITIPLAGQEDYLDLFLSAWVTEKNLLSVAVRNINPGFEVGFEQRIMSGDLRFGLRLIHFGPDDPFIGFGFSDDTEPINNVHLYAGLYPLMYSCKRGKMSAPYWWAGSLLKQEGFMLEFSYSSAGDYQNFMGRTGYELADNFLPVLEYRTNLEGRWSVNMGFKKEF